MADRVDIAVIGTGPAGISAGINGKIRNKTVALFGTQALSGKIEKAQEINNYLGCPQMTGREMQERFQAHLAQMELSIVEEKIQAVYPMGDYFALLGIHDQYEARSVVLATGVNFSSTLKGETEFLGRGLSYCATCDGALYRDRVVTLVGYHPEAESDVNFLAELTNQVYYVPMYKETPKVASHVQIVKGFPREIQGDMKVRKLILSTKEIETDGLFLLRESIPPSQLLPNLLMDGNHIAVDRTMATNVKGVFAAGDLVGTPYQYQKAAGEGNIAGLSAVSYLDTDKKE